jgi:hypothetical protein
MLLFELDFEEVSKKKLRECWSQLCRIRCTLPEPHDAYFLLPAQGLFHSRPVLTDAAAAIA